MILSDIQKMMEHGAKKTILERLIIINAISSKGWLRGAKRLFQANKKTEDYHAQMNRLVP